MADPVSFSSPISPEIKFLGKLLSASILCAQNNQDPKRACDIAEKLVELIEQKDALEEWARWNVRIEKSWADGIKYLTGETRLKRAQTKFLNWLKHTHLVGLTNSVNHPNLHSFIRVNRGLVDWRKQGFSREELENLKGKFERTEKFLLPAAKAKKAHQATTKQGRATK